MTETLTRFHARGGQWVRPGQAVLDRDETVVYGATLPVADVTCGLTDPSVLTNYNGSATATVTLPASLTAQAISDGWVSYAGGILLRDKTIYGDIRPPSTAVDIYLINCKLKGGNTVPASPDAVVNAGNNRTAVGKYLYVIDCEVDPQLPALNRDGIRGNRIRVFRTYVHDVIDGISPFAFLSQNGGVVDAQVYGCYVERLRYGFPDYTNGVSGLADHNDGTHNDGMQLHGGTQVHVKGNYFNLTSTNLPTNSGTNPTHPGIQAAGLANGQCILITKVGAGASDPTHSTAAADGTVVIEENWFRGGLCHVSMNPGPLSSVIVRNNRFSVTVYTAGTNFLGRWIRVVSGASTPTGVPLLADAIGVGTNNAGNVWSDGPNVNDLLTRKRAQGVMYESVGAQPY